VSRRPLAGLESSARSLGYVRLRLETGSLQHAAIKLYESSGYARIDRYGPFLEDERSVCFEKRLA
jgi:putative acetyltransferase